MALKYCLEHGLLGHDKAIEVMKNLNIKKWFTK